MKDALLSLVSPVVMVAVIAVVGTYWTARAALVDVTLKRRLETAKRFTELAQVASNRTGAAGLYEQIAAVTLLGSFGRSEPHLRAAARAVLHQVEQSGRRQGSTEQQLELSTAAWQASRAMPEHDKPERWWRRSTVDRRPTSRGH